MCVTARRGFANTERGQLCTRRGCTQRVRVCVRHSAADCICCVGLPFAWILCTLSVTVCVYCCRSEKYVGSLSHSHVRDMYCCLHWAGAHGDGEVKWCCLFNTGTWRFASITAFNKKYTLKVLFSLWNNYKFENVSIAKIEVFFNVYESSPELRFWD